MMAETFFNLVGKRCWKGDFTNKNAKIALHKEKFAHNKHFFQNSLAIHLFMRYVALRNALE